MPKLLYSDRALHLLAVDDRILNGVAGLCQQIIDWGNSGKGYMNDAVLNLREQLWMPLVALPRPHPMENRETRGLYIFLPRRP